MTQMTQKKSEEVGNTKTTSRSRHWMITINNPLDIDVTHITQQFDKYVYQFEKGEKCGTEHIQLYGYYKNARSFTSVKKVFERAHIEVCKSPKEAVKYCQKDDTRLKGPFIKGFAQPVKVIETLRPWQANILSIIKEIPDDRTINWIVDEEGNKGKTALCKYIVKNYNALYMTGRAKDSKYLISKYFEGDEVRKNDLICLFDYTRSVEGYVSYQGLEEIKNGIFMNSKYECNMCIFNCPHVIVFANFEPDQEMLSKDRWNIIHL